MKIAAIALVIVAAVGRLSAPASAAEAVIGNVVRAQGPCSGVSAGVRESLVAGANVHLKEVISTGTAARLELVFHDGTHLTVGEHAKVVLDDFVYQTASMSRFHAAVTGPFRYISGKLATGATHQASITTPFAVLGVRGTDFWGGPIDATNGVLLFDGVVSVSNAAGAVVLSAPGQGTNVGGANVAPGAVTDWPADKVARALATVAFP